MAPLAHGRRRGRSNDGCCRPAPAPTPNLLKRTDLNRFPSSCRRARPPARHRRPMSSFGPTSTTPRPTTTTPAASACSAHPHSSSAPVTPPSSSSTRPHRANERPRCSRRCEPRPVSTPCRRSRDPVRPASRLTPPPTEHAYARPPPRGRGSRSGAAPGHAGPGRVTRSGRSKPRDRPVALAFLGGAAARAPRCEARPCLPGWAHGRRSALRALRAPCRSG